MVCVSHVAIFVNNLDLMERFYQAVFGMWTVWKAPNEKAYLTTGNRDIFALLHKPGYRPRRYDLAGILQDPRVTPNFPHFGAVVETLDHFTELMERLEATGITIYGPKVSRDTTRSFYFHDPEGNAVQVVCPTHEYFQRSR
ncbi:MAG: hypothetical protein G01um101431_774 [Parcubacteria group bacterium Gr01-1014_31]|nr:MAG: hypothetical protein G01um101431_774 [Parcubacteria group bacterium Gr01-1014_31]